MPGQYLSLGGARALIDVTRPCLVEIGSDCIITDGVQVWTHGYDWSVLGEKYGEVLCSSGKVVIENNVFIGTNTVVLKGVRIGKNTIIGSGSVVTHDIPKDSLAAGNPCKVIMTIDEYYRKRENAYIQEAKAYALEIYNKTGRIPRQQDFWEEFPIFLARNGNWNGIPVRKQLGSSLDKFLKSKPMYNSLREFLIDAGIPQEKIEEE